MRRELDYRAFASSFLTGLTVVTTHRRGVDYGCTANAFASISLDPPLAMICVASEGSFGRAVRETRHLCMSVLADGQTGLRAARRFARVGPKSFHGMDRTASGLAAVPGRMATAEFDLIRDDLIEGRAVLYLSPAAMDIDESSLPLAYWRSTVGFPTARERSCNGYNGIALATELRCGT